MKAGKELTDLNSCLNRSKLSEPVFVLCARDPLAPATVRQWVTLRRLARGLDIDDSRANEAEKLATEMEAWHREHEANYRAGKER